MKWKILPFILLLVIVITLPTFLYIENSKESNNYLVNQTQISLWEDNKSPKANLVAHSGGEYNGLTYTNSLEALNHNYEKGFRYFEIDFHWTSDEELVATHNWDNIIDNYFKLEKQESYTLEEFKEAEMKYNLTQLTFEDVASWLEKHPDAYLITDVKSNNSKALKEVFPKYPQIMDNIIHQAMSFEEFKLAQELGYKNLILTLYREYFRDEDVIEFAKENDNLLGVTMHYEEGREELPSKLEDLGIFSFVFTVNDKDLMKELEDNYVDGFYTDSLTPKQVN